MWNSSRRLSFAYWPPSFCRRRVRRCTSIQRHAGDLRQHGQGFLATPARRCRVDGVGRRVLLHVKPALALIRTGAGIEVNGQRVLGHVGVVQPPATHARAPRLLAQPLQVLSQAIGEHLRAGRLRDCRVVDHDAAAGIASRLALAWRKAQQPAFDGAVPHRVHARRFAADELPQHRLTGDARRHSSRRKARAMPRRWRDARPPHHRCPRCVAP